jgi:hypothetical protein
MATHLTVFGPEPAELAKAVLRVLPSHQALNVVIATATPAERKLIYDLLVAEAVAASSFDVVATVTAGWRLHHRLVAAARQSLAPPYPVLTVDIAQSRLNATYPRPLDVIINGGVQAVINTGLAVEITVARFEGTVRAGHLVGIKAGKCEVSAALTIDDVTVIGASAQTDLAATIPLGSGLALI